MLRFDFTFTHRALIENVTKIFLKMESGTKIGHEIMCAVKMLSLPYRIDDVTLADGNCFPHAILQQCRRQEIRGSLTKISKNITEQNDPNVLRNAVHQFVESSTDPQILDYKLNYDLVVAPIDNKTWKAYWQQMLKDHT